MPKVSCFPGNASSNGFQVLATDRVFCHDLLKATQCLPLYRYTPDGERVSNITEWGRRRINEHYHKEWGAYFDDQYPDGIAAEDVFAYTYGVLHDFKIGFPLEIVIVAVSIPAIVWVWPMGI